MGGRIAEGGFWEMGSRHLYLVFPRCGFFDMILTLGVGGRVDGGGWFLGDGTTPHLPEIEGVVTLTSFSRVRGF